MVNGSLNGLRSELESLSADAMARLAMAKSVETGGTALHFAVGHAGVCVRAASAFHACALSSAWELLFCVCIAFSRLL